MNAIHKFEYQRTGILQKIPRLYRELRVEWTFVLYSFLSVYSELIITTKPIVTTLCLFISKLFTHFFLNIYQFGRCISLFLILIISI